MKVSKLCKCLESASNSNQLTVSIYNRFRFRCTLYILYIHTVIYDLSNICLFSVQLLLPLFTSLGMPDVQVSTICRAISPQAHLWSRGAPSKPQGWQRYRHPKVMSLPPWKFSHTQIGICCFCCYINVDDLFFFFGGGVEKMCVFHVGVGSTKKKQQTVFACQGLIELNWAVGLDFFLHSECIVVRIQELDP